MDRGEEPQQAETSKTRARNLPGQRRHAADFAQQRIKRLYVLGDLISAYQRAA